MTFIHQGALIPTYDLITVFRLQNNLFIDYEFTTNKQKFKRLFCMVLKDVKTLMNLDLRFSGGK